MFSRLRGLAVQKPMGLTEPYLEQYRYEPLRRPDCIRLLHIDPGNGSDEIHCSLMEADPSTTPHYEALSYTWGSPDVFKTIVCDGRRTSVSANLFDALHCLRQLEKAVVFWIDQLCINQKDAEERSSQVMLMGSIYSKASRVVVWLGVEDADSKAGIALARNVLNKVGDRHHFHLMPEHMKSLSLPPYKDRQWRALGRFLQRPWFSRVWIIQEVVMSTNTIFVCGKETFTPAEMSKLVDRLMNLPTYPSFTGRSGTGSNGVWCVGIIDHLCKMQGSATRTSSIELLGIGMASKATDPRDKIYALLSLGQSGIQADYSKSVEEVYTDFAISYISQILPDTLTRQSPKFLTDIVYSRFVAKLLVWLHSTDSVLNLPSWVPDWSRFPITSFMGATSAFADPAGIEIPNEPRQEEKYRATEISILPNHTLRLSGKLCDEVSIIGLKHMDLRKDMKSLDLYDHFADWYAETGVLVSHAAPIYPTGIPWQEAYRRTLAMDNICIGRSTDSHKPSKALLEWYHGTLLRWNRTSNIKKFIAGEETNEALFWHEALKVCGRCFFLTAKGYMGLAPYGTRKGDRIGTLLAIRTPFIMREVEGGYRLIGPCYVQGIMDGEVVLSDYVPFEPITLV